MENRNYKKPKFYQADDMKGHADYKMMSWTEFEKEVEKEIDKFLARTSPQDLEDIFKEIRSSIIN